MLGLECVTKLTRGHKRRYNMPALLVTYDLKKPGRDYSKVIASIKSCGVWWHYLESTWLLSTNMSASDVSSVLLPLIDENDSLLVIHVHTPAAGWLEQPAWDWIRANVP